MRAPLRGPFGAFGAVAGLLAGSLLLPDGCAIHTDESERLRIGLPLLGPVIFLLTAHLVWRLLVARRTRNAGQRDWTLALDAGLVLGGMASLAIAARILHDAGHLLLDRPRDVLSEVPTAFAMVLPAQGLGIIALPLGVRAIRHALRAPPSSLVTSWARAACWSLVAGAAQGGAAVVVLVVAVLRKDPPLDPLLFRAAVIVAALVALVAVRATWRAGRATKTASGVDAGAPYRIAAASADGDRSEARLLTNLRATSILSLIFTAIAFAVVVLIPQR